MTIELVCMVGLDARLATLVKKRLQSFVAERFDHAFSVSLGDTRHNFQTKIWVYELRHKAAMSSSRSALIWRFSRGRLVMQ